MKYYSKRHQERVAHQNVTSGLEIAYKVGLLVLAALIWGAVAYAVVVL